MALELRLLERVQEAIYNELVALKGQEALKAEKDLAKAAKKALGESIEAPPTVKDEVKKFLDELKDWTKEQEKNAEKRKSVMDKPAQDFSDKDKEDLLQANLEKRNLARRLDDMIEELSNAGAMDFGDSSMTKTLPKMLDKANDLKDLADLAAYKDEMIDYSYNLDNAIVSEAKEIMKGSEDSTHVEPTPGSTEAPEDKKAPVYLQELPTELAVTVPPLKQKLDDYYEKIKQAGTALANSVDDNDGPISPSGFSGTSAAGKMGDATPDPKADRTGRSNVGRTGKSDGQMVGNTAPPIPDEQILIPERMSNSPMEGGKVDDKSGNQATSQGLGKGTNGFTEFGRSGKLPPGMEKNLKQIQPQFRGPASLGPRPGPQAPAAWLAQRRLENGPRPARTDGPGGGSGQRRRHPPELLRSFEVLAGRPEGSDRAGWNVARSNGPRTPSALAISPAPTPTPIRVATTTSSAAYFRQLAEKK